MQASYPRHLLSRSLLSLLLLLATAQAADEVDALPSLFDFLGAMVEQEGEWVDPLDMQQAFAALDSSDTATGGSSDPNGAAQVDTAGSSSEFGGETAARPAEQQEKKYESQ